MKLTALFGIVTLTGITLWISAANSQDNLANSKAEKQDASASRIQELQTARLATLRNIAESTNALFRHGRIDFYRVHAAHQALLKAELELAENDSIRLKLYEKLVDAMKEYEQFAVARKERAQGTEVDILEARAIRLEAEIALEQLKSKLAK